MAKEIVRNRQETQHAYFAGLVDGDGCITVTGGDLSITVTNSYKPVLDDLCSAYGGGVYNSGHITREDTRQVYRWRLWCLKAVDFIRKILPYLRVKRNQALVALQYQETTDIRHRTIPPTGVQERRRLIRQIRGLNGGPKP